jgi:hypothetical protein
MSHLLGIDVGTTGSKALLVGVARLYHYPWRQMPADLCPAASCGRIRA